MNKKKQGFIHIGFSSILMVFTMLCLVTFATLSLITANSDYRLSKKAADKTTAYYQADTAAKNYLLQLDTALSDLYEQCSDREHFFSGLPEVMQSLTPADTISDVKTTVADSQIICAFQVTINEVQQLEVTLALSYPEHPGDEFYKITQWQTVTTNEPAADDTLHLFSGN
jgi:hypothetical protein